MDFQKLLENKALLYGIIGGAVIGLAMIVTIATFAGGGNKGTAQNVSEQPIKEDVILLTTDNIGKALEIQALLAKQGIAASRTLDGTKSSIVLKKGDCTTGKKKCTTEQRDIAIMEIVQSGLMDQNVGLEVFDKGDFTSTKEDKKIRLTRAINGELSRLIKRIDGVENASVFISIPEQTMFTSMQKPVTATVQLVVANGTKLDQLKIKAITNLLLGSVSGLNAEDIAISDTNGNVYHSIMNASDEMLAKLEENDKYMQQKVQQQLDRLIGKGNYVATVSTFLRQAPAEKYSTDYDPERKASVNEQSFTEGLGDQTRDSNKNINAVSVYLPNGIAGGGTNSSQDRSYSRSARETQYGVSKTQLNEYLRPGMVEEISVAVTLEKSALPAETTLEELKELIAHAASPKVDPENVSIAFSDSVDPYLASDRPVNLPKPDESGNPWWLAVALSAIGLIIVFRAVSNKVHQLQEANAIEVERLRQKEAEQDRELSDVNMRAAQLTDRQRELAEGLLEQQNREYIAIRSPQEMISALENMSANLDEADSEEAADKIKSWIEKG